MGDLWELRAKLCAGSNVTIHESGIYFPDQKRFENRKSDYFRDVFEQRIKDKLGNIYW